MQKPKQTESPSRRKGCIDELRNVASINVTNIAVLKTQNSHQIRENQGLRAVPALQTRMRLTKSN